MPIIEQWEYLVRRLMVFHPSQQDEATEALTEYGVQGWELVGIFKEDVDLGVCVFKRRVPASDYVDGDGPEAIAPAGG